jgi:hypothetical protein
MPSAAGGAIRDTGARGEGRFHWTYLFGETEPVAEGRRHASWAYSPMWMAASRPVAGGLTDHWCGSSGALDAVDYWLTQARLRIVDALYDPDLDGPDHRDGDGRQQAEEAHRGDTPLSRG